MGSAVFRFYAELTPEKIEQPVASLLDANETFEFLTPSEVAKILRVSTNTVISRFSGMKGVMLLPALVQQRRKRDRYRQIRIPRYVLDRFIAENTYQESTPVNTAANRKGMRLARAQEAMREHRG